MERFTVLEMCEFVCNKMHKFGIYAYCHANSDMFDYEQFLPIVDNQLVLFDTVDERDSAHRCIENNPLWDSYSINPDI